MTDDDRGFCASVDRCCVARGMTASSCVRSDGYCYLLLFCIFSLCVGKIKNQISCIVETFCHTVAHFRLTEKSDHRILRLRLIVMLVKRYIPDCYGMGAPYRNNVGISKVDAIFSCWISDIIRIGSMLGAWRACIPNFKLSFAAKSFLWIWKSVLFEGE